MKKQLRYGFTLVELLVVISIIGMLAGLLLPAINAARESGRRAVCMANQSQIAMALLNYENARGAFPPMRGVVFSTSTGDHYATWAGFLLPLMEYNQAWERLSGGRATSIDFQDLPIPILKCKSASLPSGDNTMSYVVNGGYQNGAASSWTGTVSTQCSGGGLNQLFEPGRREDAVFFDHLALVSTAQSSTTWGSSRSVSIDYISTHSGTSYTLLLSENTVDDNYWLHWDVTNNRAWAQEERHLAFTYPVNTDPLIGNIDKVCDYNGGGGSLMWVRTNSGDDSKSSWKGYEAAPFVSTGTDSSMSPLFLNQGRTFDSAVTITYKDYRRARPASQHPGVVVAAFADRSARTLNENMDKKLFVHLCQPSSGVVINPAQLNQ